MVTSHIQWHKKSSLVILSQVYKRKLLKISKSFRVIKKKKTYFQIKLTNQNDLRGQNHQGKFSGKRSSWSSYFNVVDIVYSAYLSFCLWLLSPFQCLSRQCDSEIENVFRCDAFPWKSPSIVNDIRSCMLFHWFAVSDSVSLGVARVVYKSLGAKISHLIL